MAAERPPSLFALSAAVVSRSMGALERDVWGLSTQPIWRQLWDDVMKTRPPNSENITCWRKKFLETFFSNVLHGVLDISSDWRLNDHHFSPLLHSSPHVSQLTLCNMLQGAVELAAEHNHKVLENLAGSLRTLKFQHLLSSDQSIRRSLVLLLHRLIHHGSVSQVSMYSWPIPDTVLLLLILSMSAGFWRSGNALTYQCGLCREEDKAPRQELVQERAERYRDAEREGSDGENQKAFPEAPVEADAHLNSVLSVPRSSPLQNQPCEEASSEGPCDHTSIQGGSSPRCGPGQLSCHPVLRKTRRRLKPTVGRKRRCLRWSRGPYADPDDLYDFVFTVAREGLDANICCILSGLRALSRRPDCRLRVLRVSDVFSHMPCMELVRCVLSAFPQLYTLSVSFDLKNQLEGNRPEGNPSCSEAEIPESCLEQLEIRFPREPLHTTFLLPVLKASKSLQQLSLDSATLPCSQELGLLLEALKECTPNLKKLSFHDVNLAEHQKEVLLLLQDPILQGNHRLVALADIFSEDSSSSLCQLDVSSNCIKPDGLLEFTKKLEGHIQQRGGQIQFTHLRLFQNWLDQDAETAQEALRRLKALCSVVNDSWDSSQAFADYISVM
ncbi:hypothetical protein BTVI_128034 [Pitangus sulphuratus]|nr:hypothetical protein BTVI_128034 [Pitangus sulphuratus]